MTSRARSTPAPRPTLLQTVGARLSLHARRRPAVHALYGAGVGGAAGTVLMALAATPGLADPGTFLGSLAAIPAAGLLAALVTGVAVYLSARALPDVETVRPEVYAAAGLQALTGRMGPHAETNRAARQMSDHLVRANSPGYLMAPLVPIAAIVSVPSLTDLVGPDFEPLALLQLTPVALLSGAMVAMYFYARDRQARLEGFRAEYDRHAGGPAPTA